MSGMPFDVVIPDGNEREFIDRAVELGYKEILFLVSDPRYVPPKDDRIVVRTGYMLKDVSEASRSRKGFDHIFAPADRKFFEQKIDFVVDAERSPLRDSFHYRSTSLNQVHAELAKKNRIGIVFSFSALSYAPREVFGRMRQNAALVNKYRVGFASFSMAKRPEMMRSRTILDALSSVLSLLS